MLHVLVFVWKQGQGSADFHQYIRTLPLSPSLLLRVLAAHPSET